jgi:hypothetical protein
MITYADITHIPEILKLLKQFANATPISSLANPDLDTDRASRIIHHLIRSGVALVSISDDQVTGMLLAGIVPDMWLPHIVQLREYAWWVTPEYRNSSAGYRLLQAYVRAGEQLKQAGKITDIVLTTLVNSPIGDIQSRGWRAIETNYVYSGRK